jgi:transglutaminase/protease-like cytokinesis protein 3
MKQLVIIFLLLANLSSISQEKRMDFSEIDRKAQSIKFTSPALLARQLTAPYKTEIEKVRSIFRWIAENIEYRTRNTLNRKTKVTINAEPEDTGALKPLDERVAESVLEKGTAVCDGYARLFKTLCTYAGIHSELVTGYARTQSYRANQRFRSNHTWNAVRIDSVWKLVDVTWASGYISWQGDVYVQHFGEEYFLPDPREFIREHYPDDIRWTLLDRPPAITEFRNSPFKQKTFLKYSIAAYRPAGGVLEANLGDTVQLELDISDPEKDKRIGSDPFLDTSSFTTTRSALLVPSANGNNRISYSYIVTSVQVEWLYVLYNNDVILRYRLLVNNRSSLAKSAK